MRDHDKYLKELVLQLEQHRKGYKTEKGETFEGCKDNNFCPLEQDKIIALLKAIVIDLKEFGEWKEKMEKNEGGGK